MMSRCGVQSTPYRYSIRSTYSFVHMVVAMLAEVDHRHYTISCGAQPTGLVSILRIVFLAGSWDPEYDKENESKSCPLCYARRPVRMRIVSNTVDQHAEAKGC